MRLYCSVKSGARVATSAKYLNFLYDQKVKIRFDLFFITTFRFQASSGYLQWGWLILLFHKLKAVQNKAPLTKFFNFEKVINSDQKSIGN